MTQKETITAFYVAFQQLDAKKMIAFYHDNIIFEDPAFGILKGVNAKKMWEMLCKNATDLNISFNNVTNNSAHWEATYTFSQTGKKVHNIIEATFEFKDGEISNHIDTFNIHHWAKQAFGVKGLILGGTGFFKKKLQQQTFLLLQKFVAKNSA